MKINLMAMLFTCLGIVSFSGCWGECRNKPGSTEYEEIVSTISVTNTDAVRRFSEFSVDQQITIALFARDCPDDPRIEPFLILNGEKKIPVIVDRIKKEEKLWDKGELVLVLISINTECRCISKDSEIIKTLEQVGEDLDNDPDISADYTYKQIYKRNVDALKHQLDSK